MTCRNLIPSKRENIQAPHVLEQVPVCMLATMHAELAAAAARGVVAAPSWCFSYHIDYLPPVGWHKTISISDGS
jgi:hypothetical protein